MAFNCVTSEATYINYAAVFSANGISYHECDRGATICITLCFDILRVENELLQFLCLLMIQLQLIY